LDKKIIGERLKELRIKKGLTIKEMADAVGVSCSTWSMYEIGERIPRDEIKIEIANYFKKSVNTIFYAL